MFRQVGRWFVSFVLSYPAFLLRRRCRSTNVYDLACIYVAASSTHPLLCYLMHVLRSSHSYRTTYFSPATCPVKTLCFQLAPSCSLPLTGVGDVQVPLSVRTCSGATCSLARSSRSPCAGDFALVEHSQYLSSTLRCRHSVEVKSPAAIIVHDCVSQASLPY